MALIDSVISVLGTGGRLAGTVATRRGSQAIIRRAYGHSTPSPAQANARAAFAACDRVWGTLTTTQKQAWRNWQKWRKNWGYNRFMGINIPRQLAGLPLILNPADIP